MAALFFSPRNFPHASHEIQGGTPLLSPTRFEPYYSDPSPAAS
jgi:hypothetical protein